MFDLSPPPANEDSEKAVLGSILIEGELIEKVYERLNPNDFYKSAHQKICKAMFKMSKLNIGIDIVTISNFLRSEGILDEIGGSLYLTNLIDMTPTIANIEHYVNQVNEASNLRKIFNISKMLIQDIGTKKINSINALEKIEKFINKSDIKTQDNKIIQLSREAKPKPREWILENLIPKGFPSTIYSSGGVGKSLIAISIGLNACIGSTQFIGKSFFPKPLNTLFIDYELDKDEIMRRVLALCNGMGLKCIPDNYYYQVPGLRISKCLDKLRSIIKRYNIELLIIDSVGASGVDAMDEKSVILIYDKLKKLGTTSILIDHQSKMQTQDNPDSKSPYGTVYKTNMSGSVIHLVGETNRKGFSRIKLVHKKTNFGAKCDEFLIDIHFDTEIVVIEKSNSLTKTEKRLSEIRNYMLEKKAEGKQLNQKNLVDYFEGSIGREAVRSLLEKGNLRFWNTSRGINNSIIYDPIEAS